MELEDHRAAMRAKFAKMGVANAGQMQTTTQVQTRGGNTPAAQKLAMIKSGAERVRMDELVRAGTSNSGLANDAGLNGSDPSYSSIGGSTTGFSPMKLPKIKKRPGQKEEPVQKVEVASFAPRSSAISGELDAIGNIFGGKKSRSLENYSDPVEIARRKGIQYDQNPKPILKVDYNDIPEYNHQVARQRIQQKNAEEGTNYLKYSINGKMASQDEYTQNESMEHQYDEQTVNVAGNSVSLETLKEMMDSIAKGAIKSVLENYESEKRQPAARVQSVAPKKGEMLLEFKFNEKNTKNLIMMDASGQHYRVTPVNLTSKK